MLQLKIGRGGRPLTCPRRLPFLTASLSPLFAWHQRNHNAPTSQLEGWNFISLVHRNIQGFWSGHTILSGRNQSGIDSSPKAWLNTYFQPCAWHWAWPHTMHPHFHSNSHQSGTKQRHLAPHRLLHSIHRPLITTLSSSRKKEAEERSLLQK